LNRPGIEEASALEENQFDIHSNYGTAVGEAYKSLRANIQFCSVDKKIRSITVTSCNPTEGKTTTAVNISIALALSGMKVLMIDADMRKPSIHKNPKTHRAEGLSNYLSGYAEFEEIISETTVENCFYISCGVKPPNPAELIGAKRFEELLKRAEDDFDLVIIDTPPLGSLIDAAIIAAKTTGTIIVINSREVSHKLVKRVKEQLEKANAHILGVVLNKVRRSDFRGYYSYYGYYDGHKNSGRTLFRKKKRRSSGRSNNGAANNFALIDKKTRADNQG